MLPDATLDRLVSKNEYLWATDVGIANYIQRRHNPTRHAQMLCISSPNEQRIAVADLKRHPPSVVLWEWLAIDSVDGFTRQYIIANHILRNYRPEGILPDLFKRPYAVPTEPGWPGLDRVTAEFAPPQDLHRLPDIWGRFRWPRISSRIVSRHQLGNWMPADSNASSDGEHACWRIEEELAPRDFNYLLLEFAVGPSPKTSARSPRSRWPVATLEFSSEEEFDENSRTTFDCSPDGQKHIYLVPIGCHPCWTWRSVIRQWKLSVSDNSLVTALSVWAYEIDDLRSD